VKSLTVLYGNREVGRLVEESQRIHFAYSRSWLEDGFPISPRSLPLEDAPFTPANNHFDGLFGVFADSLPDGWGTYTAIRSLAKKGISYIDLGQLEKLALIGPDGLGALRYEPSDYDWTPPELKDLDHLCEECMKAIEQEKDVDLDDLFRRAGSTGGARPKMNYVSSEDEWIVKFKERNDPAWIGRAEYEYNLAAKECGIEVPEVRLFPSEICDGYFASKRFDRAGERRIHMISLGGLLEVPRQLPLLDYVSFLQATGFVTRSQDEVVKAFRLACFNILSKNMDSHSKNFSYIYSEEKGGYVLSPAYDLTRTIGMKEHEMTCMGKGNPDRQDLLALADEVRIPVKKAKDIVDTVADVVSDRLSEWTAMM
jgi:serine/threonine-protein kinase HipA